jgi:hypothetical protein
MSEWDDFFNKPNTEPARKMGLLEESVRSNNGGTQDLATSLALEALSFVATRAGIHQHLLFENVVRRLYPQSETSFDDYNDFMARFYRFCRAYRMGPEIRTRGDYSRRRDDMREAWRRCESG